jgi:hypothetical protein
MNKSQQFKTPYKIWYRFSAQQEVEDAERAAIAAAAETMREEPPDPRGSPLISEADSEGDEEKKNPQKPIVTPLRKNPPK